MFSGELSTPNLWSVQDSSPGTLQTFWESGKVENSPKNTGESEGLVVVVVGGHAYFNGYALKSSFT